MTRAEIESLMKALAPVIRQYVSDTVAPLLKRIGELEQRVSEAETRGLEFCGVYQRAAAYKRGAAVTAAGSLWIAIRDVEPGHEPGESRRWVLAVKRGRDGKDSG